MNERHEAYLYHITFNAMHNLTPDDPKKMHAHTFCVGIYVIEEQEDHPIFVSCENALKRYFDRYRGIRLNELSPFNETLPTLENMGEVFYWDLKSVFKRNGMNLLLLEMGTARSRPIVSAKGPCLAMFTAWYRKKPWMNIARGFVRDMRKGKRRWTG